MTALHILAALGIWLLLAVVIAPTVGRMLRRMRQTYPRARQ